MSIYVIGGSTYYVRTDGDAPACVSAIVCVRPSGGLLLVRLFFLCVDEFMPSQ